MNKPNNSNNSNNSNNVCKVFFILILNALLNANETKHLSSEQNKVINTTYNIGKLIKANDGMSFEYTTSAIALTESSAGKNIIGDESHNKRLREASLGTMQIRLATAKEIIKKDKIMNKYFKHLLKDNMENRLITLLLTNVKFSSMIGATFLKIRYNYALKRGFSRPYFHCISRYNGGNHNKTYYKKVIENIKKN